MVEEIPITTATPSWMIVTPSRIYLAVWRVKGYHEPRAITSAASITALLRVVSGRLTVYVEFPTTSFTSRNKFPFMDIVTFVPSSSFSTNFALTYTDNHRNWDGSSTSGILGRAYNAMPNMSVWEYAYDPITGTAYRTGDYYKMLPSYNVEGSTPDGYSSRYLSDMKSNGNPVAMAHQAFNNQSTYRITPQFNIKYKLLGTHDDEHQLDLNAEVYMDIYNESVNTYFDSG